MPFWEKRKEGVHAEKLTKVFFSEQNAKKFLCFQINETEKTNNYFESTTFCPRKEAALKKKNVSWTF